MALKSNPCFWTSKGRHSYLVSQVDLARTAGRCEQQYERTGRSWTRLVKTVCEYQSAKALEVCDKEVALGEQAIRLTLQVDQKVTRCEE